MKKLVARLLRQSPAMVVAMVALFVSLAGTAVATTSALITGAQIKNGSITGADIKNKSVTAKDIKGQLRGPRGLRGLAGPAGAVGPQGLQGAQGPGARWAAVNPNGTIAVQSGGIVVTKAGTGTYIANFGEDISGKLIVVSPATVNDPTLRGTAVASPCAPPGAGGLTGCPVANPQNYAFIGTLNSGDAATGDHGFYIAVIGPAGTGATALDQPTVSGPLAD